MSKPPVGQFWSIEYFLETASKLQIVSMDKNSPSYQTIKFEPGTKLYIFISKEPIKEK